MADYSKYKKLILNTSIFAIANFGSSVLKFLIIPFYTYYMTTTEYGIVDMVTTSVNLVLPFVMMSVSDAVLRYSLKKEVENSKILTASLLILMCGSILFGLSYFLRDRFTVIHDLWGYVYSLLICEGLYAILANFTRGCGKCVEFAIAGVVNTIVFLVSNIILLARFHMGLNGYLYSLLTGFLAAIMYLIYINRKNLVFSVKNIDFFLLKKMLSYSIPLMPTAMMWWLMNASDRYVITYYLGVSATGIYAVSHKIPTIMNMLYAIFQQAWQVSAFEECNSKNREEFYSNIFNYFSSALFIAASFIILIDKPLISYTLSESYVNSWKYVPLLVISAVFSSLAGFLGINYAVAERTIGAFITSFFTAVANLVLNIVLTPIIGIQGTAAATLVGFISLWLVRSYDTKKYIKISQNYKYIIVQTILLLIQSAILIFELSNTYLLLSIIFILVLIVNQSNVKAIFKVFADRLRNKLK